MSRRVVFTLTVLFIVLNHGGNAADLARAGEPDHRHSHGRRCTAEYGQQLINQHRYEQAIRVFTCVINEEPTGVEGYRGRIEAQLLAGHYSDALGDYSLVTALVLPVHPGAADAIVANYTARLAESPNDISALTGASFVQW